MKEGRKPEYPEKTPGDDRASDRNWRTFHVSSTLVCQFLLVAQLVETSTTKSLFLRLVSNGCDPFCKFRMTFT